MDVKAEIEKRVDKLMKDNYRPMFFRPYLLSAAWIGASTGMEDFAAELRGQEKDNQILNEVFKNN